MNENSPIHKLVGKVISVNVIQNTIPINILIIRLILIN